MRQTQSYCIIVLKRICKSKTIAMNKERQLRKLKVSPDLNEVSVDWVEVRTHSDDDIKKPKHRTVGDYRPHKDLVNKLKKLRKHGLDMLGIELADMSKDLSKWAVLQ